MEWIWVLMAVGLVAAAAHGMALVVYLHYFGKGIDLLRSQSLDSPLHGRFKETLSSEDLRDPQTSPIIATKLREFHDLDMPGPRRVVPWDRLKNYQVAKRMSSTEEAREFCLNMMEEISSLENELSSKDQRIGFCHQDLWHGNL